MAFYFRNLANPSRVKAVSVSENPAIIAYAIRAFASPEFRRVDANFSAMMLLNPRHITRALRLVKIHHEVLVQLFEIPVPVPAPAPVPVPAPAPATKEDFSRLGYEQDLRDQMK
jgi:hypothetical protein